MDISSFTPLNGWMVIKPDDLSDKTESGLLYKVSHYSEHLNLRATVLKVSKVNVRIKKNDGIFKYRMIESGIKPGARILFPALYVDKYYFIQFREMFGKEYALLKPDDVLLYENLDDEGAIGIDDLDLSITSSKVQEYDHQKNNDNNRIANK
jgi:co-chaperonin GroES (HSP10)